jgi:REP element-mobilizing transposase RayT
MKSRFLDDHYYHVYNRGVHKSPIFFSDDNYEHCLSLLKKYNEQYGVSITAYCLMPNHYHLLLRQDRGGSIARFLQTTFNAYTQAVNKQELFHGTLFEGRAQSLCVDSEAYLLRLVCYIHCNPVIAGLVGSPELWKFSDFSFWIGKQQGINPIFVRDEYFTSGEEYADFLQQYLTQKTEEGLEKYLFEE